jgi:V/A-type H+-transporting ATPase subunit K
VDRLRQVQAAPDLRFAGAALSAGYAVAKVGSAALGAASERPEIMGRALVFVVIAEGIAVWGLVGAILLMGR